VTEAEVTGGALIELHERAKVQRQALHASTALNAAPARSAACPGADNASELEGVGTSKRRKLATVAAAVAFGASLDQPAMRIIAQADEPQIPTTVRPGDVRELRVATEMLEAWDHQAGGTAVRHHILGALRWGTGLLKGSCTPDVHCTLAATVAQLADLAAWATFDAGLNTQARELFLLGLHAAPRIGRSGSSGACRHRSGPPGNPHGRSGHRARAGAARPYRCGRAHPQRGVDAAYSQSPRLRQETRSRSVSPVHPASDGQLQA
jgi:hypothetical protein